MPLSLSLKNIFRTYNGEKVLDGLSCAFSAGETHILMGANGCGKSTLLRICALLEQPDNGILCFDSGNGELPHDLSLRRRITLVLPKAGVFNSSVLDNIAYGLKIRSVPKKERTERVEGMLKFTGLEHKRDRNALTLSSGETQRMGIGRALVIEPDLLLLDEPTASIDRKNTELIEEMILQMKCGNRPTIIMTTHDRQQAERLSSGIMVLKDGGFNRGY